VKAARDRAPPRRGASLLWFQGLLCGALIAVSISTALLLAALLLPGLAAVLLDREPGRPVARTVLLFGVAASAAPFTRYWESAHTIDAALGIIGDPMALGIAWLAAGFGWALTEFAPVAARLVLEAADRRRIVQLKAERTAYEEEWGLPPQEPAGD